MNEMRLQRYLSRAGVASRRKAERLIEEGQVKVNGKVVKVLGSKIDADKDRVSVAGEAVRPPDYFYAVFNKPKGCITTMSDPEGRTTVMDYLPRMPDGVRSVGRLDFNSEGVLLFTNDGGLANSLLSAASHAEKTYHVKVQGQVPDAHVKKLRDGVRIGPREKTQPCQIDRLRSQSKHSWFVMTLTEGRSRQIHRMFESVDVRVSKIQRVAFAGISFHGLRVGDARELAQQEVNSLYAQVGQKRPKGAVATGAWTIRREDTELGRRARKRALDEVEAEAAGITRRELDRRKKADKKTPRKTAGERGAPPKKSSTRKPAAKKASTRKPAAKKASTRKPVAKKAPSRGKPKAAGKTAGKRSSVGRGVSRTGRTKAKSRSRK